MARHEMDVNHIRQYMTTEQLNKLARRIQRTLAARHKGRLAPMPQIRLWLSKLDSEQFRYFLAKEFSDDELDLVMKRVPIMVQAYLRAEYELAREELDRDLPKANQVKGFSRKR